MTRDEILQAVKDRKSLYSANLRFAYLRGADLGGANLRGADLRGANLEGANLWSASLLDANLGGAVGIIDAGERADRYRFVGWIENGTLMVRGGCRDFTLAEAHEHWNRTRFGTDLGQETTAILLRLEAGAKARGLIPAS